MASDIFLVRHTPVATAPGLCYGRTDVALADDAPAHIEAVCERLRLAFADVPAGLDEARVVTSPSTRCLTLANAILDIAADSLAGTNRATQRLEADERLMEFDFGTWEGQLWAEVPRAELDAWSADLANVRPPGGENLIEVQERALASVNHHLQDSQPPLVVVTHGGVIRALIAGLLQWNIDACVRVHIEFGHVSCVRLRRSYNELRFLNR